MVPEMRVHVVNSDSRDHFMACELRREVFFSHLGSDFDGVRDDREEESIHAVIRGDKGVCACGRLTAIGPAGWVVTQMCVDERWRGRGLGSRILTTLLAQAVKHGGGRIELASRLKAVGFYRRFGFIPAGEPYPSPRTGAMLLRMVLELSAN